MPIYVIINIRRVIMKYLSVAEVSKLWGVAERTVRNYCAKGMISGVKLIGKTWNIPETAVKLSKLNVKVDNSLLTRLKEEKECKIKGGIYHKVQVDMTYNSNHIEGSKLTHDQTRYIFETNTIGINSEAVKVDDIVETANHFKAIDYIIDNAHKQISETMIKELHRILKSNTTDSRLDWFAVGEYKKLPNQVGGNDTTQPEDVAKEMKNLLAKYNQSKTKSLTDLLDFHYQFETIHPFQDGNGRVGRLLLIKECLKNEIVPFIIDEDLKFFYYRGLHEWKNEKGFLTETCLMAQDKFKIVLDYFKIEY